MLNLSGRITQDVAHFKSQKQLFSVLLKWQLPRYKNIRIFVQFLAFCPQFHSYPFPSSVSYLRELILQALFPRPSDRRILAKSGQWVVLTVDWEAREREKPLLLTWLLLKQLQLLHDSSFHWTGPAFF